MTSDLKKITSKTTLKFRYHKNSDIYFLAIFLLVLLN